LPAARVSGAVGFFFGGGGFHGRNVHPLKSGGIINPEVRLRTAPCLVKGAA
jgi:hypothetical protein